MLYHTIFLFLEVLYSQDIECLKWHGHPHIYVYACQYIAPTI